MKKFTKYLVFVIALLILPALAQAANPPPQYYTGLADANDPCSNSTLKSQTHVTISSATTTALVTSSGGSTNIYVCEIVIASTAATAVMTIQFEQGTGATCGTGTAAITGVWEVLSASTSAFDLPIGNGGFSIMRTTGASGQNFCAVTTGTTGLDVYLTYVNQ